ncbi:MAG: hypothetical protein ACK41E_11370 [Deinococcales bacterium]
MKKELRGAVFGIGLTLGALALAQSVQRTLNVLVNGQPNPDKAIVVNNTSYIPARVLRNFGVTVTAQGNNLLLNGSSTGAGTGSSSTGSSSAGAAGTTQLAGSDGRLNVAYTVGRDRPLNFTLNAAEYRLEPIALGRDVYSADGTQKLLILRFTVQNPNKAELDVSWQSFKMTAVDSNSVNHVFDSFFARDGETAEYATVLKPAQRVNLVAAAIVPADANITKLLLERNGETAPIVRYDLRNQIKPLAAPYSNNGVSALPQINAQLGTTYLTQSLALRVESFAFSKETLEGNLPGEGKHWVTATVSVKNLLQTKDIGIDYNTLRPTFIDVDGATLEVTNYLVRATSGQRFFTTLKPNAEVRYRYYIEVDENVGMKEFAIKEGERGRVYVYDTSNLR